MNPSWQGLESVLCQVESLSCCKLQYGDEPDGADNTGRAGPGSNGFNTEITFAVLSEMQHAMQSTKIVLW